LGNALLVAATLSFLGLGAQPPSPEWGAMLSQGREFIFGYWWIATFPGLAILLAVIGAKLLGEGLRDLLGPRLRVESAPAPADDARDAVHRDLGAVRDAAGRPGRAEDGRDAALARQGRQVRRAAAALRHDAGHAREHRRQGRPGDAGDQDVAEPDPVQVPLAPHHAGPAGRPAEPRRMAGQPRVPAPEGAVGGGRPPRPPPAPPPRGRSPGRPP